MPRLSIVLLAPAGLAREISAALGSLAHRARLDPRCVSSEVYASVEDQNRFLVHAEWTECGDLARYVESDDFAQVMALMEMAPEPPVVAFLFGGEIRGLDYVAEVRGRSETQAT